MSTGGVHAQGHAHSGVACGKGGMHGKGGHAWLQGLSIPFACVGSGDPVRVLCLYTTNTLDTL